MTTPTERIDSYLARFRLRLQQLNLSRGIAATAVAAIAITLVAVTAAIRTGFPDVLMLSARLALAAAIGGLAWYFVVRPNRRLKAGRIDDVEARAPEFDGRIRTYTEMRDDSPFRDLLADDALSVASRNTPEKRVPQKEFSLALGSGGAAVLALLLLGIAGPGNYGYGVRDLWLGWVIPGVVPPQSIEVTPGDSGIRAGGTVRVRALPQGFSPGEAWVHARFGDDDWQQVSMANRDGGFEFTFFSVREPLEYYVSAASVRSQTYRVRVVDLPSIDRLTNTYKWPDWTGREPETKDPGGDVRAIADTDIEVTVVGSDALTPAVLVVGDREIPLDLDGANGRATFTVDEDGEYHVAAVVGGERIRLTEDYFVSVIEDQPPEIEFSKPGRDWSASAIEEVTARISAKDDFRIEKLSLHYSVNGGAWTEVEMAAPDDDVEPEHVFYLESLASGQPPDTLVPGDLVSYFAVAEDRNGSARTDMFFVDVQPFDRRYSQSQMGGGGQGGGQQQDEISRRQREIIVSTWNLIREQQENRQDDVLYVPDNAALLSRLQETLRDQAMTLAQRTRARMLTASDPKIAEFVTNLEQAAEAMVPAAERLSEIDLEEAILPEQEALQHLLRAEAVFNDINVSMQANNRGGGGQAGRDLTDMFELEMDLEKNQYETGSQATPEAPQQQLDEIGSELEDLARRQEQLANRMREDRQPTPAQRWQQDMLRREAERLREQLERMQQSTSNAQQDGGQGSADSEQSGRSQSAAGGPRSEQERQLQQLRARLDDAVRAMTDADDAMRQGAEPGASQRAAEEAQRQLEGARDQAAAERERLAQAELESLGDRANEAYRAQAGMEQKLLQAIREMMRNDVSDDRLDSGLTFSEEMEMAAAKRKLQTELQRLEQDVKRAADGLEETSPNAADELEQALAELREQEVDARLAVAANYIEIGEAVYISGSESAITESLREFTDALRAAREMAGENGQPGNGREPGVAETLADMQALRRQLQQAAATRVGQPAQTGRDDRQQSTGVRVPDIETFRGFDRSFEALSDDLLNLFRQLREDGVAPREIDHLRRLASELRASDFSGNEALLEREAASALALVEQMELALTRAARPQTAAVRTTPVEPVSDEHREPVANYFRRLGESGDDERK